MLSSLITPCKFTLKNEKLNIKSLQKPCRVYVQEKIYYVFVQVWLKPFHDVFGKIKLNLYSLLFFIHLIVVFVCLFFYFWCSF